ncbi:MAG: Hsp20/alpha crystallin family protein [Bacteroidales bacterium]|nr:Hsp20/alpha crystallin family protein [Bacteroidales bacterium]
MPSLLDEFFGDNFLNDFFESRRGVNLPSVNIKEEEDAFNIEVAAPGLEKDDFRINLENNILTISSEKEDKDEDKDENYMRREFSYSAFKRSFNLPETADVDNIKAEHNNGVLAIKVPKKEEARKKPAREIKIS